MPDERCGSAFACIRAAVRGSHLPEDPAHAEDTLRWLLFLCPDADDALRIAALGHDIERALPDGRVLREEYADYDAFKQAHVRRSAAILAELLHRCGFDAAFVADVASLNRPSRVGGRPEGGSPQKCGCNLLLLHESSLLLLPEHP